MNNRQKAKHFKRLYESQLLRPVPIVYRYIDKYQHYRIQKTLPIREVVRTFDDIMLDEVVISDILKELKPLIRESVVSHRDDAMDSFVYSVDLYIRKGDTNGIHET